MPPTPGNAQPTQGHAAGPQAYPQGQQGYPQQGSGHPQSYPPAAGPAGRAPAARSRNVPGLVSLILGAATMLWAFVFLFIQAGAIADATPSALGALAAVNLTIQGLLSVAGLVFGVIGLVVRDRPRAFAGIGTGIAIAGLVGAVVGLLFPLVIGLAYG
ncbi:hypothetical protein ABC304_04665 [Microbacterium sp. 1P10UB]|uniref:hypothetical protein n=2 Tax=unclassified Microbacterium TaxID=2609290 RepID=UPI0039A2EA48